MSEQACLILQNDRLRVEILPPSAYSRSRYDWSGMVRQVLLDDRHTFLSREYDANGGSGLGGVGLCSVFEWEDDALCAQAPIAGMFPLMGVGLLKKTDTSPFLFTKDYPVSPFSRITSEETAERLVIRTLPQLCSGVAFEQQKCFSIQDSCLTIEQTIRNVGPSALRATEFCHNFLQIDQLAVDGGYQLDLCHPASLQMRRGEVLLGAQHYRLGAFDPPTASSAFWVHGYEGLGAHWMRLSHAHSPASVLIETEAPVCRFYSWNNAAAFCPETFVRIALEPGELRSFRRKYTFSR